MKFVFSDFSRIAKTLTVSYDSKHIYIWRLNPPKLISKILHNLTISDSWQRGWWATIISEKIEKYLPRNKADRVISGGLLTPFIALQKAKNVPDNPYTTKESYFATIVHEFGHVYWNSYKLWWPSDKKENLNLLRFATNLYTSNNIQNLIKNFSFRLPPPAYLGEVFAFCTEYWASEHFWEKHKKNIDLFTKNRLKTLAILEKKKNLNKEDSVIEPNRFPHDFASILGKIILTKYPQNWPKILTKPYLIF